MKHPALRVGYESEGGWEVLCGGRAFDAAGGVLASWVRRVSFVGCRWLCRSRTYGGASIPIFRSFFLFRLLEVRLVPALSFENKARLTEKFREFGVPAVEALLGCWIAHFHEKLVDVPARFALIFV